MFINCSTIRKQNYCRIKINKFPKHTGTQDKRPRTFLQAVVEALLEEGGIVIIPHCPCNTRSEFANHGNAGREVPCALKPRVVSTKADIEQKEEWKKWVGDPVKETSGLMWCSVVLCSDLNPLLVNKVLRGRPMMANE